MGFLHNLIKIKTAKILYSIAIEMFQLLSFNHCQSFKKKLTETSQ